MKEALRMALEALEDPISFAKGKTAITAIKEALSAERVAQPERPQNCGTGFCSCIECVMEPVAIHQFRSPYCSDWYDGVPDHHDGHGPYEVRILYTTLPQPKEPEQEPVAWWNGNSKFATPKAKDWDNRTGGTTAFGCDIPLYTTPPQCKPLTDAEIWKFWWSRPEVLEGEDDSMEAEFVAAVRAVLAAHNIKE